MSRAFLEGRASAAKQMATWLGEKRDLAKKNLDEANSKRSTLQEVGDFLDRQREEARIEFSQLNCLTISAEKFACKLQHELNEFKGE